MRTLVLGNRGMVGSAVVRKLGAEAITIGGTLGHRWDLRNRGDVDAIFSQLPEKVILCAARVGGIHANSTRPAEFIYDNLMIQSNVIDAAYGFGVKKLLFLGSSCIYPRNAEQPIKETALLTGPLEETNRAYAVAKIAGIEMCQSYRRQYGFNAICAMPTNLYGPGDNFSDEQAHVIPSLIRKFHRAKESRSPSVTLWGTGEARREFLHVDDMAEAAIHLMNRYDEPEIINVGCGYDLTIRELADMIAGVVGYQGAILFDRSKPDGTPRKVLDVTRIEKLGWWAKIPLLDGLVSTYEAFAGSMEGQAA